MVTRQRRRRSAQAGFTLVEVMIALLLTVIAVIGIVGLYRVEAGASNISQHMTEAAALAQDKSEVLRTQAAATGGPEIINVLGQIGQPDSIYTRSWTVTPDPLGQPFVDVVVTVKWFVDTDSIDFKSVTARSRKNI